MHRLMQMPSSVSAFAVQHRSPTSQLSRPEYACPVTEQASPGCLGAGSSGMHLAPVHSVTPSAAYGAHFSPCGQSCSKMSHTADAPVVVSPVVVSLEAFSGASSRLVDPGCALSLLGISGDGSPELAAAVDEPATMLVSLFPLRLGMPQPPARNMIVEKDWVRLFTCFIIVFSANLVGPRVKVGAASVADPRVVAAAERMQSF